MTTIEMILVDLIDPHPHNPRRDLGDLTELAESIKVQGLQQNLLVVPKTKEWGETDTPAGKVPVPIDGDGRYQCVIGHRRLAAAKLAGLVKVPAAVREISPAAQLELMLLENVQRRDLTFIEEAEGYQELLDLGVKVREIAKRTGRSQKTVTARLQLLKLSAEAQEKVHTGQATLEDAAEVAALSSHPELQAQVASYLGSSNFKWQLSEAKGQIKREAKREPLLARLAQLGIAEITPEEKEAGTASLGSVETAAEVDKLLARFPDVDPTAMRYRAVDWMDGVFISKLALRDLDAEAERVAERMAQQEESERGRAEAEALFTLRDEWVRSYIARKRTAAKDQLAIVAAVAPFVLTSGLGIGRWQLANFLGASQTDSQEVVDQILAERYPDLAPTCMLLLAFHLGAGTPWSDAYRWPIYGVLYGLLEQLGYPVNDAERARLTPPADEPDEDEESAS